MRKWVLSIVILAAFIGGGAYFVTTGPGEYGIGLLCYSGLNNTAAATTWFQKAAVHGYAPMMAWVKPAAAAGYAPAEYDLGLAEYEEGDAYYVDGGLENDHIKSTLTYSIADIWLQRAYGQGYQPAGDLLATAYLNGNGVPQDVPKAMAMLKALAIAGYAPSEYFYGLRLALAGDLKASSYWMNLAADQGYTKEILY